MSWRQSTSSSSSSYEYDFDTYGTAPSIWSSSIGPFSFSKRRKAWIVAAATLLVVSTIATLLYQFVGHRGAPYLSPELHKRAGIMTLDKPYDRLRDVVWDLPVRESDVALFWQTRETGSDVVVQMLGDCFKLTVAGSTGRNHDGENDLQVHRYNGRKYVNVDTTTLGGLDRARDLGLVSSGLADVIVSPHIRQVSDIFTEEHQGRMWAFFRHPIEREYARAKAGKIDDNSMTRLLIDKPKGELNFKDLGIAKKVIREKVVVGLLDQHLYESIDRIYKYYGWTPTSDLCVEEYAKKLPYEQLGDRVDGDDAAWKLLHKRNEYDVQLYEFARSVFRAQRQTIVPLKKQIQLADGDK